MTHKSNGQRKDIAARVKETFRRNVSTPKPPPPAGPFMISIAYDPKTGNYGFSLATANPGVLDMAALYAALDAGRKHVMGLEQQAALRQAQPAQPGAAQKAEGGPSTSSGQKAEGGD